MNRFISFLFLALISFQTNAKPKTTEIVILCTNDIHGRIDNFPRLATYLQQLRANNPHVLLVNSGDMFSGNPLVDQYVFPTPQRDTTPSFGYPIIDLMNDAGYQLTNIGNHEFDYGQDVLNARRKQANFPFICANVVMDKGAVSHHFKPSKRFKVGGTKILFLALLQVGSGGTPDTHPDRMRNLTFPEPIALAKTFEKERKKNDVVIALSHLGIESDLELAAKVPYFDLVLGGHSHTRIDTVLSINNTLITQTGAYLRYVSETRLTVSGGKLVNIQSKLIDLNQLKDEDQAIQSKIAQYKANDPGLTVIAQASKPIKGKFALGALMTDAITKELGLDIAFQNGGGIRQSEIKAGDIQLNTIYSLDPFRNEVVKVMMTYNEIMSLLTFASTKHDVPDLFVSGLHYTVYTKDKMVTKIELFDTEGNPLDQSKTYSVGMNSYIYSKYEFAHQDSGKSLYVTSAGVLINYVKKLKTVDYTGIPHRIKIIKNE